MFKDAIKRAFTVDGGSFFRVRDEDGKISTTAILATIIRLALLFGVVWGANALGVPVSDILSVIGV